MYSDSQVLAADHGIWYKTPTPPSKKPTPSGLTCTYNQTAEINCINPGYLFSRIYNFILEIDFLKLLLILFQNEIYSIKILI